MVNHGSPERATLDRVSARADFIEEDERRQVQPPFHRDDVGNVGREGRQARGNRLLVADI